MQKSEKSQIFLLWIIRIIAVVLIAEIGLSAYFYPEPYLWLEQFISNLGTVESRSGLDNTISRSIFTGGLLIIGALSIVTAIWFFLLTPKVKLEFWKGFFLFLMGLGAVGTSFTPSYYNSWRIHVWGTGIFIFSFIVFNLICQFFHIKKREITSKREKIDDIFDKLWVIVIIITAGLFLVSYLFWWNTYIMLVQKILVLMIFIAVWVLDPEDI